MDKNHIGLFCQSCAVPIEKSNESCINTKAMRKQFYIDAFFWGFVLWLIGYLLGMILFFVVPPDMIGWVILPIGIVIYPLGAFEKDKRNFIQLLSAIGDCLDIDRDCIRLSFDRQSAKSGGRVLQT